MQFGFRTLQLVQDFLHPSCLALYLKPVLQGDSAVDANDMTFWMVQKHELKVLENWQCLAPRPEGNGTWTQVISGDACWLLNIVQCSNGATDENSPEAIFSGIVGLSHVMFV